MDCKMTCTAEKGVEVQKETSEAVWTKVLSNRGK